MNQNFKFIEEINSIQKTDFDKLVNVSDAPFINYGYLFSLENSHCVSRDTGWQPNHLISIDNKALKGFLPIYLKYNSQGEFVFDHSWSYALNRTGRNYFPKLVTAIPFTPCETRKIIGNTDNKEMLSQVINYMGKKNIETWHVLFPDKNLSKDLLKSNFIERMGYKFVWKNKNYNHFDDYLNIFKSRQRKNIKNERKKIAEMNISFEVIESKNIKQKDWEDFYFFYKNTYSQRLQRPYLNEAFFKQIDLYKREVSPVIFFAVHERNRIAGSLCFRNDTTLYGRHWGGAFNIDSLHFECCYYQGIEYCINNKIKCFDPGVQGEHKIRRGFEPIRTHSYHYIKEKDFNKAVFDFCKNEKKEIEKYLSACKRYTPIKKEYRI